MPYGIDGIELLKHIRSNEALGRLPVVSAFLFLIQHLCIARVLRARGLGSRVAGQSFLWRRAQQRIRRDVCCNTCQDASFVARPKP